jgi:hypothetical protein
MVSLLLLEIILFSFLINSLPKIRIAKQWRHNGMVKRSELGWAGQ